MPVIRRGKAAKARPRTWCVAAGEVPLASGGGDLTAVFAADVEQANGGVGTGGFRAGSISVARSEERTRGGLPVPRRPREQTDEAHKHRGKDGDESLIRILASKNLIEEHKEADE